MKNRLITTTDKNLDTAQMKAAVERPLQEEADGTAHARAPAIG